MCYKFACQIKKITILIVIAFLLTQCNSELPTEGRLEDKFKNPPIENRPMALWPWLNGYVDTAKMVYELEEMKNKGMQGAFIWDLGSLADPTKIIPAGPAFLSEKSMEYITLALKTGRRLGLNLGMMAASSWNAGGEWINENDASKELLSTVRIVTGPSKKKISIERPKIPTGEDKAYVLISSIAIPHSESNEIDYPGNHAISLDKYILENKYIDWEIPEGKWDIISFFMCNTGQNLECPSPNSNGLVIDHLSKGATEQHFNTILSRLAKVSKPDHHLNYLVLDSYEVMPAKDWTPVFVQEFILRYGYNPTPFLPLIQGYRSKDSILGERFLGDYSRLVSDLIIENHFIQSVDIANKAGIKIYAEAGHGGYARVDPLKALGNSDIPTGEFWNRQQFWVTKEAASAAHIYGKKIVAAESLTGWQNWQQGPTDFKQLFDIAFCEGLNQVVFHTFAHNPEIAGKPGFAYHAGEHINVNTTWWEMAKPFMDYLSRCSYMLRQGNFVGDACLYYGDQAPNWVPSKRIDPNISPAYDERHCLHCGQAKPVNPGELPGYDYDYINSDIINNHMKTENGKLVLPSGQSYKIMLLPDRDYISPEVLKSLEKLIYEGAIVIGRKPIRSNSLKNYPQCDNEVMALADKIWGKCDGKTVLSNKYGKGTLHWGKSIKQVLDELNIPPDFEVKGIDNSKRHIDYIHQKTEEEDIYFVSNSAKEEKKITCVFRVGLNKVPELWDAETGLIQRKVQYSKVGNGISIDLIMNPLASIFVVFRNRSTGENDTDLKYDLQFGFNNNRNSKTVKNESYDISYNWNVKFSPINGGPESYQLDSLVSWSDIDHKGIKYYSGSATYEKDFSITGEALAAATEAFVLFNDIQEMVRVNVNGNDCGVVWTPPYKACITPYLKAGQNKISVQSINTWNNRIVGDLINPSDKFSNTNIKSKFKASSPLLKSGLIGKAEIQLLNMKNR